MATSFPTLVSCFDSNSSASQDTVNKSLDFSARDEVHKWLPVCCEHCSCHLTFVESLSVGLNEPRKGWRQSVRGVVSTIYSSIDASTQKVKTQEVANGYKRTMFHDLQ